MLRRVEIHNFRSCRSVVLDDLTPVTALVGPNGAGKTNVLQAIVTAARSASQAGGGYEPFGWLGRDTRVSLEFETAGSEYRYTIARQPAAPPAEGWTADEQSMVLRDSAAPSVCEQLEVRASSSESWCCVMSRRGEDVKLAQQPGLRIGRPAAALPALRAMLASDHPTLPVIVSALGYLSGIRYYELHPEVSTQGAPVTAKAYLEWRQAYKAGDRPGPTTIKLLHLAHAMPERFEELRSLMGPNGLELVDAIAFDEAALQRLPGVGMHDFAQWQIRELLGPSLFEPQPLLDPRFQLWKGTFAFDDLSAGTRRILSLLTSLLLDDSSVLLIEHPEDGIHPGLARKLLDLLRGYTDPATIVLTTHSTNVMDELQPEECRLVSMKDGSTTVRAVAGNDLALARAFLEDTGTLSEYIETAEQD